MYADVLISVPVLLALLGVLTGAVVSIGVALRLRLHLWRHIKTGREDISATRAGAQDARKRSLNAATIAKHVQRGAETDAERITRLQAEVAVRSRGRIPLEGN